MTYFRVPRTCLVVAVGALLLATSAASPARAAFQLIDNGGFEAGFASWTTADFVASDGTFALQTGTTSPVNGFPVPAPPGGLNAAMTDAMAGGSHVLYQDFVVPTGVTSALLRFSLFLDNQAVDLDDPTLPLFASPDSLDWTTPVLNQQARVDILRTPSDPFSVDPSDVLLNVFQTNPGDTFGSGYLDFEVDITPLLAAQEGQTLRLRFAEVDNVFNFLLGVDDVSISPIPEPSSLVLYGIGAAIGLVGYRRRYARSKSRACVRPERG